MKRKSKNIMKRIVWIGLCVAMITGLASCNRMKRGLPSAVGDMQEVLVVMDKALWEGRSGDSLRSFLLDTILWSPLNETRFDITHIPHDAFSSFRRFRNIVSVNVSSSAPVSRMSVVENRWANSQVVISIVSPSPDSLAAAIPRFGDRMISLLEAKERERLMEVYERSLNRDIQAYMMEKHQVGVQVPRMFTLDVATDDFVWMSRDEQLLTMGVLFWSYPYTDTLQLTLEQLLEKRNEMTSQHVPGPIDSSYMVIEDLVPPVMQEFIYKDRYCIRINGWWKTEKAFMGGPFESVIMVDEERNRIITLDGFIYYPQEKKRRYLMQLDAILLSMKPLPVASDKRGK